MVRKSLDRREKLLSKIFFIIRKNQGIRPRELHKLLNLEHSWSLRLTLIKRGLIKKEKDGNAVRYYPIK